MCVCFRRCDVTVWCHQININHLLILWCKSFEFSHEWHKGEEKMHKWKPKCHSGCSSLSFSSSLSELSSFLAASTRWCTKSSVQKLSIKPSQVPAPYFPEVQWPRSGRSPEAPPPCMSEQQHLKEWRTQRSVCVFMCFFMWAHSLLEVQTSFTCTCDLQHTETPQFSTGNRSFWRTEHEMTNKTFLFFDTACLLWLTYCQ